MTNRAIKLRMYPTLQQVDQLPQMFGNSRFTYNYLLRLQQWRYRHNLKHLSKYDMNNVITQMKRKKKYQWLKRSESTSLQMVSNNLNQAYQHFFKHQARLPRFKKRTHNQSYTSKMVNNNIKIINDHHIKIAKLGIVRCQAIRKFIGKIKQATVEIKPTGKYYLVIIIDATIKTLPKTNRQVGIDLGLRNLANLSNGRKYKTLHFNDLEYQLKIWQRKFARRRLNAKRTQRQIEHENKQRLVPKEVIPWFLYPRVIFARQHVAKIHAKMANLWLDYLQKLSTSLVKSYDVIAMEDLKAKNLQSNHHLAKAIGQQGWRMFREMLTYKCQWYSKTLKIVAPNNTTQICHNCGYQSNRDGHKIELNIKEWQCPHCSVKHDRDHNAAINILNQPAKKLLFKKCN